MKGSGVRVIFEQDGFDTADTDSELMIAIVESFAQAKNESRSDIIKWGLKQRTASGTSKLYVRKCYGYDHDENGRLIINEGEAVQSEKLNRSNVNKNKDGTQRKNKKYSSKK